MAGRYETIKRVGDPFWVEGYPVILQAHALVKDTAADTIAAQCKFQNIGGNSVSGIYISLACFGADGRALPGVEEYALLDLNAAPCDTFGDKTLIPLPDKTTRKYTVFLNKVICSGVTVWQAPARAAFSRFTSSVIPLSALGELEAQYHRVTPENAVANLPEQHDAYWRCGCGQINLNENGYCAACGAIIEKLIAKVDRDTLKAGLAAYEKKQRQLADEQEKRKQIAAAKKKKQNRITAIIGSAAAVVIAAILIITLVIIPKGKYSAAQNLLAEKKYDEAITAFEALGDYKDSAELISESQYQAAQTLFAEEQYDEAIAVFEALGDYKDASDMIASTQVQKQDALNQAAYEAAEQLLAEQKYSEAIAAFEALGDYKDAPKQKISAAISAAYEAAEQLLASGDFGGAAQAFSALGGYKDSAERATIATEHWLATYPVGQTIKFGDYS